MKKTILLIISLSILLMISACEYKQEVIINCYNSTEFEGSNCEVIKPTPRDILYNLPSLSNCPNKDKESCLEFHIQEGHCELYMTMRFTEVTTNILECREYE